MNWLDIYKPKCIKDFTSNINEVNKAVDWITRYKTDLDNTKKVLLIIGDTGCGKTVLADILFKDFNYQKIELNSGDLRSQKKLSDFLKKSLTYRNVVDMFNQGNRPIGILLDEIDTICNQTDKGGMSEFLDILKINDKSETYKKNLNIKKKMKKSKINADNYIKLYNPIICTLNDVNDKKINELKKYSELVYLRKPVLEDLYVIIDNIYKNVKQNITEDTKKELALYSQYDIRRLIILLEDLHNFTKGKLIDHTVFDNFKKCHENKEEDIQLINATKSLLSEKMDIQKTQVYFGLDCLLTPLMIHQNCLDYIKNSDDKPLTKLNIYKNVLHSLSIHDIIQTNIFEIQEWDELTDVASIFGATTPNYYFNQLIFKKKYDINIEFTNLLNKICQMYVNKKLMNGAHFSIGKLNIDNNEIIYLTEIISEYFDKYKESMDNCESEDTTEENEDQDENGKKTEHDEFIPITKPKKLINNSDLVLFMNRYNISIDGLENILKLEKLNKYNEKKKKKFTAKIKKDICNYLTTDP